MRFRNQPIPEPFSKEELLTKEGEPPVPQEPPREETTSESKPPGNSKEGSRVPLIPQAVPIEAELCVTVSQQCPRTAFTIKLRIKRAPIEAVVDIWA